MHKAAVSLICLVVLTGHRCMNSSGLLWEGSALIIMKNTLYLLKMGFSDLNYPGSLFLCPDCTLLEGVLATNLFKGRK